jgi:predicted lipase
MEKLYAQLALDAYQDNIPASMKIENRFTSTVAFIQFTPECNYVVFRGTNSFADWVFNLTAVPAYYNGRWSHAGFSAAHKSVWKRIRRCLNPHKKTVFIGHSLGGALAELSAWACRDFDDVSLVTFGKPNVFVRGSKKRMHHKNQISYVSGSDVVARIPKIGYAPDDNQDLIYFDNWGHVLFNPPRGYIKNDFGLGDSLSDHSMKSYKQILNDMHISVNELRQIRKPFIQTA